VCVIRPGGGEFLKFQDNEEIGADEGSRDLNLKTIIPEAMNIGGQFEDVPVIRSRAYREEVEIVQWLEFDEGVEL
jgi:hypothetical protein